MSFLSPKAAGAVMRRARQLLAAGELSRTALVILDCLMFGCRKPGQPSVRASLSLLERLTHSMSCSGSRRSSPTSTRPWPSPSAGP